MALSHLKSHKYFKDTPNQFCVCDNKSIESIEHYLLCCPLYCPMCEQLFTDLNNEISIIPFHKTFLTCLLLYGNESFSAYTNNFILKCSINYIMNTKRFHGPLLLYQQDPFVCITIFFYLFYTFFLLFFTFLFFFFLLLLFLGCVLF